MKLEGNWKNKSLENLEKNIWNEPEYSSYLTTTCHKLRKKQIKDFDVEDLRIMIGQNIGLFFLIPLGLEILKQNILAEGNFYEGDLLSSVLTSEVDYWKKEKKNWSLVCNIFNDQKEKLDYNHVKLLKDFKVFQKIN
jgi:hypothetical protein